jgi:hypothetical protein
VVPCWLCRAADAASYSAELGKGRVFHSAFLPRTVVRYSDLLGRLPFLSHPRGLVGGSGFAIGLFPHLGSLPVVGSRAMVMKGAYKLPIGPLNGAEKGQSGVPAQPT